MRAYVVIVESIIEAEGTIVPDEGTFRVYKCSHNWGLVGVEVKAKDWFVTIDGAYIKLEKNILATINDSVHKLSKCTDEYDKKNLEELIETSKDSLPAARELSRKFLHKIS